MSDRDSFTDPKDALSRRHFLRTGAALTAAGGYLSEYAEAEAPAPELKGPLEKLESSFFTPQFDFRDVSRGTPVPHSLPPEKLKEVGLTRETWKLEVISDPAQPATLGRQLTIKGGTALDFQGLLELGKKHAVRFAKVMTCLNIGCPLGHGIWEGVPLREVVWLTQPSANLRRVMYHGFHNNDPKQLFRSTLPVGRVLEDPYDLPPIILCYKLNGHWLEPARGGPVRMVVPEGYGFKSVKWLTHVVLTNLAHSNDTYAGGNNDIDSPLKTFAATLSVPSGIKQGQRIPITGYAQVGISGLSRVQVWIHPEATPWPKDDPYFSKAPWTDARILPPPEKWGGNLPGGVIPGGTLGFEAKTGRPKTWPMRLGKIHWAAVLAGLPAGKYTLRCRTIDEKGQGQPMPRPFRTSGHCAIDEVKLEIKE
jgi:DMSO/TMAO reductase YedYZ molybdopterin-dependent catalytic subunit